MSNLIVNVALKALYIYKEGVCNEIKGGTNTWLKQCDM